MFTPFYGSLPKDERRMWLEVIAERGETHVPISREWNYPEIVRRCNLPAGSISPAGFADLCEEIAAFGLVPCVHEIWDNDPSHMPAVYDGRMRAELLPLRHLASVIGFFSPGWEIGGSWRSKAICDAMSLHRDVLGSDAILALHGDDKERFTGASYHGYLAAGSPVPAGLRRLPDGALVEDDDPTPGDEAGWWNAPGAREIGVFLWQSRHGRDSPSYSDGDSHPDSGTWLGRFLEGFERFAPPETFMPALGRKVRERDPRVGRAAPDWFGGGRPRVRAIPYELQWFEYSRDACTDERIGHVARLLASYGVTEFGSGVPR